MVRIGLTMYLVLATVAGPAFCCCVPVRIADLLALGLSGPGQSAAATPQRTCCHHAPRSTPHDGNNPSRDHEKPGCPDSPNCPCKQPGSGVALLGQDSDPLDQTRVRNLTEGPVAVVATTPPTCLLGLRPDLPGYREGTALPFLTGQDYLTALHILLC
jgi:hypothetical protein